MNASMHSLLADVLYFSICSYFNCLVPGFQNLIQDAQERIATDCPMGGTEDSNSSRVTVCQEIIFNFQLHLALEKTLLALGGFARV